MSVVAYVTESGSVHQPSGRDRQVGWWWTAAQQGFALANYERMNGEVAWIVQDHCQPDRATCGLSLREWDAWVRADRARYWV